MTGDAFAGAVMRPLFSRKRSAFALGYWTGLAYGMGEALALAVLFTWPSWGPLFGLQTFSPYKIGWPYVWERLWAMNLHAVMGALTGLRSSRCADRWSPSCRPCSYWPPAALPPRPRRASG